MTRWVGYGFLIATILLGALFAGLALSGARYSSGLWFLAALQAAAAAAAALLLSRGRRR